MAPFLFVLILGASDLSRVFYYSTAIANAAREGARHGAYYDPLATTPGNTYDNDTDIFNAVNAEASYLNLTEPCHPNTSCAGGLTNCPSYPYASSLYPPASDPNAGYVFICFKNSATATTAAQGAPVRVTILYNFRPMTPFLGASFYAAASTELTVEGLL
jgi:Flp pilus assembly protein TadG